MFYSKLSHNFIFHTNIEFIHFWYFLAQMFFQQTNKYITFDLHHQQQVQKPSYCYQMGSTDCYEVDLD